MQPAIIAPKDRLIVPLDLPGVTEAEAMIARLGDSVSFYKIGYQLAYAGGLPLAQQLALRVSEPLQRGIVHLRHVQQGNLLRLRVEPVQAEISHRLVRGLNGGGIQLHPAAVRKFHKLARGGLQTLQVGGGELQSFLFPSRGHGEPVNAAAVNDEPGAKLARRQEQPLKRGVAQILRVHGPVRPRGRQRVQAGQ